MIGNHNQRNRNFVHSDRSDEDLFFTPRNVGSDLESHRSDSKYHTPRSDQIIKEKKKNEMDDGKMVVGDGKIRGGDMNNMMGRRYQDRFGEDKKKEEEMVVEEYEFSYKKQREMKNINQQHITQELISEAFRLFVCERENI